MRTVPVALAALLPLKLALSVTAVPSGTVIAIPGLGLRPTTMSRLWSVRFFLPPAF